MDVDKAIDATGYVAYGNLHWVMGLGMVVLVGVVIFFLVRKK